MCMATPENLESTDYTRSIEFNVTDGDGEPVLATCSDTFACSPWPTSTQPSTCVSVQDSYTWWWETVPETSRFPIVDSKLFVQRTYYLITDFTTVEGVEVALHAQVTGWSSADVSSQLVCEDCTNDTCITDTRGDMVMMLLVDHFSVVADGCCISVWELRLRRDVALSMILLRGIRKFP